MRTIELDRSLFEVMARAVRTEAANVLDISPEPPVPHDVIRSMLNKLTIAELFAHATGQVFVTFDQAELFAAEGCFTVATESNPDPECVDDDAYNKILAAFHH